MNCREFENIILDLARGRGLEEAVQRDAAVHEEACVRCASRLAAQREVAGALHAFASSTEDRAAPERVEAALIAAFARQKQTRPARRLATLWAFAAAAAAVAGIAFLVWPRAPRPVETPAVEVSKPKPPQPVAIVQVAPRPRPRRPAPKAAAIRRRARSREVMTQFYPLEYVDSAAEQESGPIIRVQVPRSMLVSFGLPIDQDRVFEPVEADVVLDDTGTARAIRFVHTVD